MVVLVVACRVDPMFERLDTAPRQIAFRDTYAVIELPNGLDVAVLPDTRTNLVTVNVRYETGSVDDPADAAGLAHYVEHLLFYAGHKGAPVDSVALHANAFTSHDRTHFWSYGFENDLDAMLEVEARRMTTSCADLDPQVMARERDVVIEEHRSRAHDTRMDAAVWGAEHPYGRWIGSTDFQKASAADVCRFIEHHYGTANATLVVSGNVGDRVLAQIRERFGKLAQRELWPRRGVPNLPTRGEERLSARVERPTIVAVFPAPAPSADDAVSAEIAAAFLEPRVASVFPKGRIRIALLGDERARVFTLSVEVEDPKQLDGVKAKLRNLRDHMPRQHWNVEAARREWRRRYARDFDEVLTAGRELADLAARKQPSRLRRLRQIERLTRAQLARWMASPIRIVELVPDISKSDSQFAQLGAPVHDLEVSRLEIPESDARAPIDMPVRRVVRPIETFLLSNGMRVVLAADSRSVGFDARLVIGVGRDSDGARRGLAARAAQLLAKRVGDGREMAEWYASMIVDDFEARAGKTSTTFRVSGLSTFADWHLWRLAYTVLRGTYAKRPKTTSVDGGTTRARKPPSALFAVFLRLIDSSAAADIPISELEAFRKTAYRPSRATLIVSGNFEVASIKKHVQRLFGGWEEPAASMPAVSTSTPPFRPGAIAIESVEDDVVELAIAFPLESETTAGRRAAHHILGEMVSDRLRDIRERFGLSYGVNAGAVFDTLLITGSVQLERVDAAFEAIKRELDALPAVDLVTFARARRKVFLTSIADTGTASSFAQQFESALARREAPTAYSEAVRTALPEAVMRAAATLRRDRALMVLRGPRQAIDRGFTTLGIDAKSVQRHEP